MTVSGPMISLTELELNRLQRICDELEALVALLGLVPADTPEFSGFVTLLSGIDDDAGKLCEELHDRMAQAKREQL